MIYAVKTTAGREEVVARAIANRAIVKAMKVKAVFHPAELKGYIFVEIGEGERIEDVIRGIPHVKGFVRQEIPLDEIKKYLEEKPPEIKISRGDIVEIIAGPFKGEKGKVIRVDEAKEEVTVEFLDVAVPIPTTIPIDNVRVIERAEE